MITIFSTFTSVRCVENTKFEFVEGKLRSQELSQYLDKLKAVRSVWISEDATAIVSKLTYDPKTNQVVGILLPTNTKGCPIPFRLV